MYLKSGTQALSKWWVTHTSLHTVGCTNLSPQCPLDVSCQTPLSLPFPFHRWRAQAVPEVAIAPACCAVLSV